MDISVSKEQGILQLSLSGDLIGENSGAEIIGVVSDNLEDGIKSCALDLSGIRYMNSSGIGVMITIMTKFKNRGGEIVLVNPSDQIVKLLSITKLDSVFKIMSNTTDALGYLNA